MNETIVLDTISRLSRAGTAAIAEAEPAGVPRPVLKARFARHFGVGLRLDLQGQSRA